MFHIALWEPEIAANTGNIGRLCVATGATLHLIGALGSQIFWGANPRAPIGG